MPLDQKQAALVRDLLAFIDASPTPYHAAREVERRLEAAGFVRLDERASWTLAPGQRGFTRRGASIAAFELGSAPPEEAGYVVLGAHTDSPNLRLKPLPEGNGAGLSTLGVEVYGSPLLYTWLDRDLGVAGRVFLADGSELLVELEGPVCRIPSLAIHLNREVNKKGLELNPQLHLMPVLGLEGTSGIGELVLRAAGHGGASGADLLGFDLCLFDAQPAARGGANGELLFAGRLDNLASCHAACEALLTAGAPGKAARLIVLYDHEEVGSQSASGARSTFLESVLERLLGTDASGRDALARANARSLLVSVDMAHAVHPSYQDKHDPAHRPMLGGGPVIKVNANQSYATDGSTAAAFARACRAAGVTPQYFVARNDMPCGSTIGPLSAARLGLAAVDVGNPMLAMHSCREMAGAADVSPMVAALRSVLSDGPGPWF